MLRSIVAKLPGRSSSLRREGILDVLSTSSSLRFAVFPAHVSTSRPVFSSESNARNRDPKFQMTRQEEGAIRHKKHDEACSPEQAKDSLKSIEILPKKKKEDHSKPGSDEPAGKGKESKKLKDEYGKDSKKDGPERPTAKDGLTNEELNQKLRGNPSTS